jgi:hypothetical protein
MDEYRKQRMNIWVEALSSALADIPEEQVRFHICWGNQEGPHDIEHAQGESAGLLCRGGEPASCPSGTPLIWAKFRAMAEGAAIATRNLWSW